MVRYGIVTARPPSLQVVANDIALALTKLGHEAKAYDLQIPYIQAQTQFEKSIVFIPFDPLFATAWCLLQRDYIKHGISTIIYTTVEGKPKPHLIHDWIKKDCTFVACSKFVCKMLREAELNVIDVIPHGVNIEQIRKLHGAPRAQGERFKRKLGVKVLFGTVASDHPRKGLHLLAEAIKQASGELPDAGFYVLTKTKAVDLFQENPHLAINPIFGKLSRKEVLNLIGTFDYLLHPALAEGFCLPLLEAQALGVPAIYPKYEPLTEIAHPTANFPFPFKTEEYVDTGNGTLYLFHHYKPEEMVKQIKNAYETYTCKPEEYRQLRKTLKEHAEQYDITKTYSKFVIP